MATAPTQFTIGTTSVAGTPSHHRKRGERFSRTIFSNSPRPISSSSRRLPAGCCSSSSSWRTSGGGSCTSRSRTIRRRRGRRNNSAKPFPWNDAPRYLIHDRDSAFHAWTTTAAALGIEEVLTAPRSPWQNAYAERLIESIRRECLDHIVVANARGLRRVLGAYVEYYRQSRTHLSLSKDAPIPRPVATRGDGRVVAIPQVGGLHYRYERRAA